MRIVKQLMMTVFACAGVLALALTLAAPANATTPILKHGSDWARTYYVNDDIISVHDGEADGHTVWADYYLSDGTLHRVTDASGPNNGGATHDWTASPVWITKFRVCEYEGGCTAYRNTDGLGGS